MKRCPQCEFLYEDDQKVCDMDGKYLVFDSRTLPRMDTLLAPVSALPARSQGRNRVLPAIAALILTTVLFLVYYVSSQQRAQTPKYSPAISTGATNSESNSVAPTESTPSTSATIEDSQKATSAATDSSVTDTSPNKGQSENSGSEEKPATTPAKAPPIKKSSTAKPSTVGTQSRSSKPEDSKIGSILKKTGRILKKPFKF
jgi:cytoskeletal protein RodZ